MSRLTVLFAHPSAELYGSDRMLVDSVQAVMEDRARAVVVLPEDGPLRAAVEAVGAEVRFLDVPVLRKQYLHPRGAVTLVRRTGSVLPTLVRLLREVRPDVVYVNTLTIPVWQVAARVARVPVLVHVHEAEEAGRLVGAALAAPLLLAQVTVVNSQAARAALVQTLPRLARRITLVYNGVVAPAHAGAPGPKPGSPTRLVLVGRLSPRKGTDVALAALAELRAADRDVVLDLVGSIFPGYEWFERELRETADSPQLADRVRFLGFQPDTSAALAAADVVLVPSRVEPFGNVAVEAQLAERPLVASRTQGLAEIVRDGETGLLVPPADATALAGAVGRLLDDWPSAVRLATAGRLDALARFAPGRYRSEIRQLVAGLAAVG